MAQADKIVEMRLRQLTGLEMDKLQEKYQNLLAAIARYQEILNSEQVLREVIKGELEDIRDRYGDERRTSVNPFSGDFNSEDFFPDDPMIITISHLGYIKRTPLSEFRAQHRGGVGAKGSSTRDEDFIEYIYPATNHNHILFFTQKGRCYWLKVYEIPEGAKNSKGRAIQNLLQLEPDDHVNAFIRTKGLLDPAYNTTHNLVFATKKGVIKKTSLASYSHPRAIGVTAILLRDDDEVIGVRLTDGKSQIVLANKNGRAIRFPEETVRTMGRVSTGVRGMTLDDDNDEVIGMITLTGKDGETIMVVSENGYGKRSDIEDYRITNRGGKGVRTLMITDKTGKLIAIKNVTDDNDLMIINQSGVALRLPVKSIRVMGRATQGVKLIDLGKRGDTIASVCKVQSDPEAEPTEEDAENNEALAEGPVEDAQASDVVSDNIQATEEQNAEE